MHLVEFQHETFFEQVVYFMLISVTNNCAGNWTMTCHPVHGGSHWAAFPSLPRPRPTRHARRKAVFGLNCVIRFYSFASQKIRNFWFRLQHSRGSVATWVKGCYEIISMTLIVDPAGLVFVLLLHASVQTLAVSDALVVFFVHAFWLKNDDLLTFSCLLWCLNYIYSRFT